MPAPALEDEGGGDVPEAAGLDRVRRRLEDDHELRVVHEPGLEERRERALRGRQLLAREEEEGEVDREGLLGATQRASSIITASPAFMSAAPSPCTTPSSSRPGRFPCGGTVSRCPARSTSGRPAARARTAASGRPDGRLERDLGRDERLQRLLLPRWRGDVDELERPAGERLAHGRDSARVAQSPACRCDSRNPLRASSRNAGSCSQSSLRAPTSTRSSASPRPARTAGVRPVGELVQQHPTGARTWARGSSTSSRPRTRRPGRRCSSSTTSSTRRSSGRSRTRSTRAWSTARS